MPNNWKIELWPEPPRGGMLTGEIPRGVKVTHLPTGRFEICDTERSSHANREKALRRLATRLADSAT